MGKVRVGVIGLRMGRGHAAAYHALEGAELVAICDANPDQLAEVAAQVGEPDGYTDADEMLARDDLDAVIVSVPDQFHAPLTIAALRSGRHVLCEKPMAPTWAECLDMYHASRESGRKLMIGQSYRWRQPFHAAKAAVAAGDIGEVFYVESQYWNNLEGNSGEGNWRNNPDIRHPFIGGAHALDLTRFIGGDIVQVSAYSNHMAFAEQPTDDCIVAQLVFESGAIGRALVSSGCKRLPLTNLHIYGTAGTITDDQIVRAAGKPKAEWQFEELAQPEIADSIAGEAADFVDCIVGDTLPPVDVSDNLQTMAACFAVVESAAQGGQPVDVATWD